LFWKKYNGSTFLSVVTKVVVHKQCFRWLNCFVRIVSKNLWVFSSVKRDMFLCFWQTRLSKMLQLQNCIPVWRDHVLLHTFVWKCCYFSNSNGITIIMGKWCQGSANLGNFYKKMRFDDQKTIFEERSSATFFGSRIL
jgi:hypothetical protein